jgi:hypothetical protein
MFPLRSVINNHLTAQLVEKGPVVDTGAQRGAAKYASEIVARTGNSHNMIGALGDAKTLPGIIMGCETIDIKGLPFTLIIPDESVSDPTLTDSLIPVGRLKEDGFHVSFRIPIEAYADGVDPTTVYPKYGGKIITPKPDSRTIFMEYEDETWRLYGYVHVATRRRRPTIPSHPRRQRSTLYVTERAVLSRVCLLFSKISNLQRLRLLGIILTSGIRYRLCSSKVVPSATRTYKARSYLAYD